MTGRMNIKKYKKMLQVNERHDFEHLTEGLDSISHNTATRGSIYVSHLFCVCKMALLTLF